MERRGASADGRFQLRARLGEGGMGVVYEAFDTELSTSVAIKTLRTLTGDALARFKHEFRVARAFAHPNIVRLGELFEQDGEWFFTMELVDGCDFLEHVRPGSTHRLAVTPGLAPDAPPAPAGQTAPGTLDEARLRDALIQLARGLGALHSAGIVHRDLKPSNVRLTRDGRLVLLDFGLVAAVDGGSRRADRVVGTAAYMAPEQAAGRGAVPASDWYAVGVMTYEALTGTLPLDGTSLEMLIAKQTGDRIARPRDVAPGVPVDLDRLCMDLLDPDPAARPGAADVLRRLGAPGPARSRAPAADAPGGARRRRGLI
ncbi:MAG: serine/threonine protein kinase, partial [Deltaproteobacteria bacterium]